MTTKTKKKIEEKDINYNILNALNLMHEDLGNIYLKTGFNPLGEEFVLNENFVAERFVNAKLKPELATPEFIASGEKNCKMAFENSTTNCQNLLTELETKLLDPNTPESLKEELKKLKLYLLCRIELTNNYLKNLKKHKNKLKLYENISSLNWKNAELFEKAYEEQFNAQIAINAYLEFSKQNSTLYKKELENNQLKQKAKDIILQNQAKERLLAQTTKEATKTADEMKVAKKQTTKTHATQTKSLTKKTTNNEKEM